MIKFAVIYFFLSGMSFLCGCLALAAGAGMAFFAKKAVLRRLSGFFIIAGALLILSSAEPVPGPLVIAAAAAAFAIPFIPERWRGSGHSMLVFWLLCAATIAAALFLAAVCLRGEKTPDLAGGGFGSVFVIGDSMSAGVGFKGERTWIENAAAKSDMKFIPLCAGGATVESSLDRARRVPDGDSLVILEIGGNDILRKTPADKLRKDWTALLDILSARKGVTILMFELPAPPLHRRYSVIQCDIAKKYGVKMIPARFLAGLLADPSMTVDGIHLSTAGHERLADQVLSILGSKGGGESCPRKD
jgi:hypothetical protein